MRGAAFTAGLVAALAAAPAAAQLPDPNTRGFDAVPQKATPLSSSAFVVEGARAAPAGSWHGELLLDWNVQILAARNGDQKTGNFIPWRVDGHLLGAWTVLPFLELAGDLPVTFAQGDNFQEIAGDFPPYNNGVSGGLGDLRLVPRLFTPASWKLPVDLAFVPELRFPTGSAQSFLGGNGFIFAPRANLERAFGPVRLLLNVGLRYRSTGRFLQLIVENELTGGGAVVWTLPTGKVFRRPELIAETTFSTPLSQPFAGNVGTNSASATTPWEFLIGARTLFGKHWGTEIALGRGFSSTAGYGREAFRMLASLRYEFEPEPPPAPIKDRDHDGVPDDLDKCPDEPGDGPDGCPDLDWDKDGIPNVDDRCPREPGTRELDGCPDRDGDGIPDPEDKCPDQPGPAENDGCPVTGPLVTLESDRVRLRGSVHFDYDKAVIKPDSFPLLDEVVGVLRNNPQLKHVRVEGHTDNKGTAPYNLDLSRRRAAAVVEYLVQHGIDRKRLLSAGYGFERPIADNATALGRAKNRRVEFKLLEEEAKQKPPK
jgi:outer membrane protein OmpA-like peptidoglycan-associated protein